MHDVPIPLHFDLDDLQSWTTLLLSISLDRNQEELGGKVPLPGNEGVIGALS